MDFLKENLNTIIEGDCLEKLKDFPDRSVDFIFADPPYFMQTEGELKRFEAQNFKALRIIGISLALLRNTMPFVWVG